MGRLACSDPPSSEFILSAMSNWPPGWHLGVGSAGSGRSGGTGGYGAGTTRHLLGAGIDVVDVNRRNRQLGRRQGNDDHTDAEPAARTALNGEATAFPVRGRTCPVDTDANEVLRHQRPHLGRPRSDLESKGHEDDPHLGPPHDREISTLHRAN